MLAQKLMGSAGGPPSYIEDVFSTWLIKPSADFSSYSINNGIDLSTNGGMTWFKARDAAQNNLVYDTARGSSVGAANALITNNTSGQQTTFFDYVTPNTNGFTVNYAVGVGQLTNSGINYVSWTFRKAPKFFDVVTYTAGSGPTSAISHNLGVVPGCIIMKSTSNAESWLVVHRGTNGYLFLNLTDARDGVSLAGIGANTSVAWVGATSTTIDFSNFWGTGSSYVAYLFAHDAGGFGLTGTDNVISCGSVTANASAEVTVNLGWEPQFIIYKPINAVGDWYVVDNMRGWTTNTTEQLLRPNSSAAESGGGNTRPLATGFGINPGSSNTYIYIAIRRGPMKVPTDGAKVFNTVSQTPSGTTTVTNSFASDMVLSCQRSNGGGWGFNVADKLRGSSIASGSRYLTTPTTAAEGNFSGFGFNLTNTNVQENFWNSALGVSTPVVYDIFQRAPGFFDEVCYTGNGASPVVVNHNLGVVPEFIIVKQRDGAAAWYSTHIGLSNPNQNVVLLNGTNGSINIGSNFYWNRTATTFTDSAALAAAGAKWVAYLFATCPGVSKVFSYTGNGSSQTINCGFTSGARFVMIKATSTTGNWVVFDSARGISAGGDPALYLNSTAAEVTGIDAIDADSTGFIVNQEGTFNLNATGVQYLVLAIA